MSEPEFLKTDLTSWVLGPYNEILPGPMRLSLVLDGEVIVSAGVETGFLHRGLEKAMELQEWRSGIAYVDRLDPVGAIFCELAFCMAVEEIASLPVPKRAENVRVLLSELGRISAHMDYIVHIARAAGSETIVHYVLRDREKILDLLELSTGARYAPNFVRFGGVQEDVTEGFIERVLEVCELLRIRVKEYNDLFTYNHAFIRRTEGVGLLSAERILALGVSGPNARASGIGDDVRRLLPYCGYEGLDFEIPTGLVTGRTVGDANDRFLLRLREISVCTEILRQVAEAMTPGEFILAETRIGNLKIPAGEAYVCVESARGRLGCHVVSDGGKRPARVQFCTPSAAHLEVVPELLKGIHLEDLPVVLASMGIGISEADK